MEQKFRIVYAQKVSEARRGEARGDGRGVGRVQAGTPAGTPLEALAELALLGRVTWRSWCVCASRS